MPRCSSCDREWVALVMFESPRGEYGLGRCCIGNDLEKKRAAPTLPPPTANQAAKGRTK